MSFENDMNRLRQAPMQLGALREKLEKISHQLNILRENRKTYNDAETMSFDEYLRAEQHIHAVTDEVRAKLEENYDQYKDQSRRRQEEALTHIENTRRGIRELVEPLKAEVQHQRDELGRVMSRMEHLQRALKDFEEHLHQGARQLTLEQIGQAASFLQQSEWVEEIEQQQ